MKFLSTVPLLPLSAFHVLHSTAWIIDGSCNDKTAPASVVQDALQSAFSQANAGLTAITQNPQDANYASLQKLLFPDAPGWPRVREVLQKVVGLNTQGTDRKSPNEIIIYCDLSRITTNDDGILWDPDVEGPLADSDDFKTCASTDDSLVNMVKGSTLAYVTGLSTANRDNHVMQVQICAWYAKYMAKSQYKTGGRFTLYRLASKIGTWAATTLTGTGITAMDSLSLLDNTLLHELTHTRAGGGTIDVGGPNTAYGWKSISANMIGGSNNAGESSLSVFAVGPIFADKPDNKDSIAYFCLGCALINEGSAPQQDGTLKDCDIPAGITQPNGKRQLPYSMRMVKWEA